MKAYERLLNYVKVHTTSNPENASGSTPSFQGEFDLANMLAEEMTALGVSDVFVDDNCYVYGRIPATKGFESCKKLGFIAHMDTAPDFNGCHVKPLIHPNYDGQAIMLGASGLALDPKDFPHLDKLKGRTLITTDGTSLLGADDKAGIAEIMTLAELLLGDSSIPHGEIEIAFTPDEEIGSGAQLLDLARFGADLAYTLDGGVEGELSFENFNACSASLLFHGKSIHPGDAKNKMLHAALLAMEFNNLLPGTHVPSHTEGYEGFFHLTEIEGTEETASLRYIIRDHDADYFKFRKYIMEHSVKIMNEKYGENTVELKLTDSYYNMRERIAPHMELVENAKRAMERIGVTPQIEPVRGGTDGARLSFRGLPCPNLGTGGFAFHGPFEHITVEGMELTVAILVELVQLFTA